MVSDHGLEGAEPWGRGRSGDCQNSKLRCGWGGAMGDVAEDQMGSGGVGSEGSWRGVQRERGGDVGRVFGGRQRSSLGGRGAR